MSTARVETAGSINTQQTLPIGRQIVAWVVLLFALIAFFELPFLLGGVTISDLGKLRPSSLLFALCVTGFTLVGYTPTLSAFLVTRAFQGRSGTRDLRAQLRTWRVSPMWYLLTLLGPAALFFIDEGVYLLFGGPPPQRWITIPSLAGFFPGSAFFLLMSLLAGSIGEEFGWRGFAQPRLQKRLGALKASLLVGLVWGTFHLWIMPICPHCLGLSDVLVTQYLRLIATSVFYAWIYNSTKGSLFLVMMAHAGHNLAVAFLRNVGGSPILVALSYAFAAGLLILLSDPRTLQLRRNAANHFPKQ